MTDYSNMFIHDVIITTYSSINSIKISMVKLFLILVVTENPLMYNNFFSFLCELETKNLNVNNSTMKH